MRHGKRGRKLGRTASHKRATMNNLATSLFTHGMIRTTKPKAKELRGVAERLITFAKRGDLHARRQVLRRIRNKVVVTKLFDEIAPTPGERILEIGCGSGVLARWIAAHTEGRNPILATDLNPFFLKEAAALSARAGLAGTIEFDEANAEALPFDDGTVDIAFSSTVMEECDAHKMLAEMVRVTKPGGRIGVIVRATDAHSVCGVETEPDIRAIIEAPYRSIGEGGVADARLYERFAASGLVGCSFFPHFLTLTNPEGAAWAYREPFFTGQFSEAQAARWAADKERAVERGTFVFASGLHCAVGTKVR